MGHFSWAMAAVLEFAKRCFQGQGPRPTILVLSSIGPSIFCSRLTLVKFLGRETTGYDADTDVNPQMAIRPHHGLECAEKLAHELNWWFGQPLLLTLSLALAADCEPMPDMAPCSMILTVRAADLRLYSEPV